MKTPLNRNPHAYSKNGGGGQLARGRQEATDVAASTTTTTEEDNQERMRSRFTTKTRKRSDTPVNDEGASKKAGVGSPPNNGVGRKPASAVPRSIL